jgi:hypothetical protein
MFCGDFRSGSFSTHLPELASRPISALPRKPTFEGVALFGIPVGQEWRNVGGIASGIGGKPF